MADKEIEVNGKVIGEKTKVTMSLSMIGWIIGILLFIISTLATVGYLDIKSDVKNQKSLLEKEKTEYKEEIRGILQKELRYEREKREKITEDIGEIKGDIKVILEKTRNLEGSTSGNNSIFNTSGPENTTPPPNN